MSDSSERQGDRDNPSEPGPGMRFFAELTGQDPSDAAAGLRGTLMAGLRSLADELQPIVEGRASDDPAEQEEAARRAEELRERIQRHHETRPDSAEAQAAAEQRFQERLNVTLRGAVERLEALHDEAVADRDEAREDEGPSPDQ